MANVSSGSMPVEDDQMFMVVGFEVLACSIQRVAGEKLKEISCADPESGKVITPQEISKGMGRAGTLSITHALHSPQGLFTAICNIK